jgi:hypothetical protein
MPGSPCCEYIRGKSPLFAHLSTSRLITSSTNGYDGSMMNGLQSLTQWETYFDHPTKGKLGLLNAIQVRSAYAQDRMVLIVN